MAEVRDVLARPRVQRQFPALTGDLVDRFVAALERQALVIPEVTRVFAYERDPKDEPYINLAIAAGAGYLVSRDTDILDLAKPTDLDGVRLQRHAPHLRILGPVSFLTEMRRGIESPAPEVT
jgi:predicted nucleic acid-binding protein